MRSKSALVSTFVAILAMLIQTTPIAEGRGGGRGGGGRGGGGGGGGSFSRSGGGSRSSYSRPTSRPASRPASRPSTRDVSRPSAGSVSRPAQRPSTGASRPSAGRVPASPSTRPAGGSTRPSLGNGASQLPSGVRPGADRPGVGTGTRPSRGDVGNFLGVGAGVAGGAAIAGGLGDRGSLGNRPSTRPADRPGLGGRGDFNRPSQRPQERPNWSDRSQNRNENWNQRVDNRHESWNQRQENRGDRRNDFQNNREDRWDNIQNNREDRQNWRDQNREDWQDHRKDMWDYRFDRADEIWDNCGDFYDDVFDDHWWGGCGWGYGYIGHYPANPWWWWRPVTWAAVTGFVYAASAPPPVYVDYGTTVVQEGETVYVDNKPVSAETYNKPIQELATTVEQPPPPMPPAEAGKPAEWMPLGVFALAQEEKGDPVMFFQISVNREGVISGGYQSVLTGDQKPIAGKVDKETQNIAWRVGDNIETVYATTLANLTQDVSPLAIHFGKDRVQNWLLVRMPEPPPADQPPKVPEINRTVPPATPIPVKTAP